MKFNKIQNGDPLKADMKVSSDGVCLPPHPPVSNGVNQASVVAALQSAQIPGVMPLDQQNANVSYMMKVNWSRKIEFLLIEKEKT